MPSCLPHPSFLSSFSPIFLICFSSFSFFSYKELFLITYLAISSMSATSTVATAVTLIQLIRVSCSPCCYNLSNHRYSLFITILFYYCYCMYLNIFLNVYIICICTVRVPGAQRVQKKVSDALEQAIEMVVSDFVAPGSSARQESALNH